MGRNRPSSDPFASNRRSPTLQRRRREQRVDDANVVAFRSNPFVATTKGASCRVLGVSDGVPTDCDGSGPAEVSVQRKAGHFEVNGNMSMAVHPDVTYGILVDFENNPKIFKTVSKVEVEHRKDAKMVTQHAHWNLMFWSGTFDMKMRVKEDRSKRAVSFNLDEPGFLKVFNGYWGIEPWIVEGKPMGSKVVVKQEVLPSLVPPGPLGACVSKIMGSQVKAVLEDLLAEGEKVSQRAAETNYKELV
ncbi:unnamed protein product [Sphagnum jensenii]|uniref:Coenzyme Q-binding protein COQ10 START domain-containing protein n=1 Tax=Sphagnum jensenii TaxID=128206 RepID=A0ABP0X045_9BRYO